MAVNNPPASEFIGPYRIDGRLGEGGMGEVYRGYDERLDRPVALKRVRPGAPDAERASKRFRREARAVARLHHPAIVQVYDWVDDTTGEWIVMELVEGLSLRQLMRGGPLPVDRVANLVRDILEGLAVAHGQGIVHRDLKPANVMVVSGTSSSRDGVERARILDFGLAKKFEAQETQVSEAGGLIGTLFAMSPEQVLGREVDPRSDLFSLGSLLYEMTTGDRPFRGEAAGEVLNRVCTFQPKPASTSNPEVPGAFSAFIQHLLEKDPRRRPQSAEQALDELADAVAEMKEDSLTRDVRSERIDASFSSLDTPVSLDDASLEEAMPLAEAPVRADHGASRRPGRFLISAVVLFAGLVLLTILSPRLADRSKLRYVAVPKTEVDAETTGADGEAELELTASAVRTALLRGLLGFEGLAAIEPSAEEDELDDAVVLATSTAAAEVFASRLECGPRNCRVDLRRLEGSSGRVLWTRSFAVKPDHLWELTQAVGGHLRGAYPKHRLNPGVPDLDVRPVDYEAFFRLRQRFGTRDKGLSTAETLERVDRLKRTSPDFLALHLFEAFVCVRRFQEERDSSDLERAEDAMARARALAPEDPRTLIQSARVSRIAGKLDDARDALEQLRHLEPGNALQLLQQALFFERTGEQEEALALMREVVRGLPSATNHFNLADMIYRQGDSEEARRYLLAGLERSPDHYGGRSRLAQLELLNGSATEAARLYEELVAISAEATELTNLGTTYLLLSRYDDAVERFRQALERSPGSPFAFLNLADAQLLAGRRPAAEVHYQKVLELTDDDTGRLLSVRAQALAHLEMDQPAIRTIQAALRERPNHPGVAYEAAVVHALLGDHSSAVWNANRALADGMDHRWFSFPWFDGLRERLDPSTRE